MGGTLAAFWYAGTAKKPLTPPPVALVFAFSFHTTSSLIALPAALIRVPPQPSANGLEAGKSTCGLPSPTPSVEPLSPAAQHTVTPIAAAAWNAWSNCVIACAVQFDSAEPQLIEITDGLLTLSCTAVVIASRKPWLVFGAKYTAIVALGAIAAATSMSSMTSPSALLALLGRLRPPSMLIALTDGTGSFRPVKYALMSAGLKPPPSSMMAMHWPLPSTAVGKSYSFASCGGVNDAPAARATTTPGAAPSTWKCGDACGRLSRPNTPSTMPASSPGTLIAPMRPR